MKEKQKIKINIFYGPRKEFNKKINNKENIENFTTIVEEYDRENKRLSVYIPGQETPTDNQAKEKRKISTLCINSDDYSTITESAIQNIIPIITYFDISEIYIQNPPMIVIEALKKNYKSIEETYYNYKKVDSDIIKQIKKSYNKKVIGQEKAIHKLLVSLMSFIKFEKSQKHLIIMLYGPSGVGKTETARFLSQKMGGELFYKQFSMFQNNNFSTYLFGGMHSQNSFAKELLDRNSNVILLDEFDKAHPHFYSAFYQLFDEGIYIDKNYEVKLKNSIIICTSNYKTTEEIREKLGDPIYYRFDSFIEFNDLNKEAICKIIDLKFDSFMSELSEEDKKIINDRKVNGLSIKEYIKSFSNRIKNARKIETITKEFLLDILFDNGEL